jgi:hypothetical protein
VAKTRRYLQARQDDVIDALGRVASYNRMNPRDRDILDDDVSRLREYRDHHADWLRDHDREPGRLNRTATNSGSDAARTFFGM